MIRRDKYMKKQYMRPELSVYELRMQQSILSASITDSNGASIGVYFNSSSNADDSDALSRESGFWDDEE